MEERKALRIYKQNKSLNKLNSKRYYIRNHCGGTGEMSGGEDYIRKGNGKKRNRQRRQKSIDKVG